MTNIERIKEQKKQYEERNKDRKKVRIGCVCGSVIVKCVLKRHELSKKHKDYLAEQELKNNIII